jgi:hypothetical protein
LTIDWLSTRDASRFRHLPEARNGLVFDPFAAYALRRTSDFQSATVFAAIHAARSMKAD